MGILCRWSHNCGLRMNLSFALSRPRAMAGEVSLVVRLHLTRHAAAKPRLLPTGVFRPHAA